VILRVLFFSSCVYSGRKEGRMLNLERIPDQVGYLLLTEDGAVISVSNIDRNVQVVLEMCT